MCKYMSIKDQNRTICLRMFNILFLQVKNAILKFYLLRVKLSIHLICKSHSFYVNCLVMSFICFPIWFLMDLQEELFMFLVLHLNLSQYCLYFMSFFQLNIKIFFMQSDVACFFFFFFYLMGIWNLHKMHLIRISKYLPYFLLYF